MAGVDACDIREVELILAVREVGDYVVAGWCRICHCIINKSVLAAAAGQQFRAATACDLVVTPIADDDVVARCADEGISF